MKTLSHLPLVFLLTLAACSAPQGKKYSATKRELPRIALPAAESNVEVFAAQQGSVVALKPKGMLTVALSSNHRSGSAWRLAEVPDTTVLKLISNEYFPQTATTAGQEKWVFEAVGSGDVDVRLWYTGPRREQFGTSPVFQCTVSVGEGLAPVAKGPVPVKAKAVHRTPSKPQGKRRAQPADPDSEAAPFHEPVFRSSGMLPRDQRDGPQQQG